MKPTVLPTGSPDRNRVADLIFHDMKSNIVTGRLPRGSRLPTERELAEQYGVSGPTVREAIRGLTVTGFVKVRQGSGAVVCANSDALVAMSLGAVIQMKSVNVSHALELLSSLNQHAASLAVVHATRSDLRCLREAAESLGTVTSVANAVAGIRAFHSALARAAHNPLLEVICDFLSDVQIEIAREIAGDALEVWMEILDGLQATRQRLVAALERRDAKAVDLLVHQFHERAIRTITTLPKAQEVRLLDPKLGAMLSNVVNRMGRSD